MRTEDGGHPGSTGQGGQRMIGLHIRNRKSDVHKTVNFCLEDMATLLHIDWEAGISSGGG